jgi:hypothetical protein
MARTCIRSALQSERRTRGELGTQPYGGWGGGRTRSRFLA